jgi:hypothetical protein
MTRGAGATQIWHTPTATAGPPPPPLNLPKPYTASTQPMCRWGGPAYSDPHAGWAGQEVGVRSPAPGCKMQHKQENVENSHEG